MLKVTISAILVLLFVGCGGNEPQVEKKSGMSKASYERQNSAAKESHQGLNQE